MEEREAGSEDGLSRIADGFSGMIDTFLSLMCAGPSDPHLYHPPLNPMRRVENNTAPETAIGNHETPLLNGGDFYGEAREQRGS